MVGVVVVAGSVDMRVAGATGAVIICNIGRAFDQLWSMSGRRNGEHD